MPRYFVSYLIPRVSRFGYSIFSFGGEKFHSDFVESIENSIRELNLKTKKYLTEDDIVVILSIYRFEDD